MSLCVPTVVSLLTTSIECRDISMLTSTAKYSVIWLDWIKRSRISMATRGLLSTNPGSWKMEVNENKIIPMAVAVRRSHKRISSVLLWRWLTHTVCMHAFSRAITRGSQHNAKVHEAIRRFDSDFKDVRAMCSREVTSDFHSLHFCCKNLRCCWFEVIHSL